ncbi:MAG: XRE family transcriptional regulator [Deltaproteobacteria bacterium]|nr:XRE family transcriptional regulator [Deltaproteobacteria bacterium]
MKNGIKTKRNVPTHVTVGNVFDDLGFSTEESVALKIKAELFSCLLKTVRRYKLTQRDLQKILDQPQPRVSELLNGKISKMSMEKLIEYLQKLGVHLSMKLRTPQRPTAEVREAVAAHG